MPAKSLVQQHLMALAEHHPEQVRGPMPHMTHAQLHDFAATKTGNLPEHVTKQSSALRRLAGGHA